MEDVAFKVPLKAQVSGSPLSAWSHRVEQIGKELSPQK
jgi:hypothetical protein